MAFNRNNMNWFLRVVEADASDYLGSLGVQSPVIDWVVSQPSPQMYINELRKNPNQPLQYLQQLAPVQKKSPYTKKELERTKNFEEPFRIWALIQYKKLRMKPDPIVNSQGVMTMMDYTYRDSIMAIDRNMDLIYDWFRFTQPSPEIASYSYEQAMVAQDEWHKAAAGKGEGLVYEPIKPENVVFAPKEWNGWSVQRVISENDLAVEGNLMNHCVGDYCDQVISGRSEIFSLRDEKNKPHVTLEIEGGNRISQIMGNSNTEPDDEYKAMLKQWFAIMQKHVPDLYLEKDDAFEFDFSGINNEDIDEAIYQSVLEGNEYGLKMPLYDLDIENAYDSSIREMTGGYYRRNDDTRHVQHIGKAIAWAAWERDKHVSKRVDWKDPREIELFIRDSSNKGVYWLQKKMEENDEEFFNNIDFYDTSIGLDEFTAQYGSDYETEAELEDAYTEAVQAEQDEYAQSMRSENLPYALDDVIREELSALRYSDPFLKEHFAQNKKQPVS